MAATQGTQLGRFHGVSLVAAFENLTKHDILQIVGNNGRTCFCSVSFDGTVNLNPATSVLGQGGAGKFTGANSILGHFATPPNFTGGTLAQIFAAAFPQHVQKDLFQVFNEQGGALIGRLSYLGVFSTT